MDRKTAGPSTTLRSGRDDNSVAVRALGSSPLTPNRIVIPTGAQRSGGTCGFPAPLCDPCLASAYRALERKGGTQDRRLIEMLSQNLRPDGQAL